MFEKKIVLGIEQNGISHEEDYIKLRLFEMGAVGDLPFKVLIMDCPSITIKTENKQIIATRTFKGNDLKEK